MKKINVAVVGATGVVGTMFLKVLEERNIPINQLVLFASEKSAGKTIKFNHQSYKVIALNETTMRQVKLDYVLMSAGSDVAKTYAPLFVKQGAIVIYNSSYYRMHDNVPLVVPEVNPEDGLRHQGIIANPNCSTAQAVVILKPLADAYGLKRVVISTYQAVSGAGAKGIDDLNNKAKTGYTTKFPYQIEHNVIPHIDVFLENGNTKEENKMIEESRKILHLPQLKVSATAVRVPVINAHSESINIELQRAFTIADVRLLLTQSPGVVVDDDVKNLKYPMPILVDGKDEVYVGRIRRDSSLEHGLNMFVVGDNLRKGAATNAVQILQLLLNVK